MLACRLDENTAFSTASYSWSERQVYYYYDLIEKSMEVGKAAYDSLREKMALCHEAATKAVLQWEMNQCVSGILAPIPTHEAPDSKVAIKELIPGLWDKLDQWLSISDTIQEKYLGGPGTDLKDAVALINSVGQFADKEYDVAKNAYSSAVWAAGRAAEEAEEALENIRKREEENAALKIKKDEELAANIKKMQESQEMNYSQSYFADLWAVYSSKPAFVNPPDKRKYYQKYVRITDGEGNVVSAGYQDCSPEEEGAELKEYDYRTDYGKWKEEFYDKTYSDWRDNVDAALKKTDEEISAWYAEFTEGYPADSQAQKERLYNKEDFDPHDLSTWRWMGRIMISSRLFNPGPYGLYTDEAMERERETMENDVAALREAVKWGNEYVEDMDRLVQAATDDWKEFCRMIWDFYDFQGEYEACKDGDRRIVSYYVDMYGSIPTPSELQKIRDDYREVLLKFAYGPADDQWDPKYNGEYILSRLTYVITEKDINEANDEIVNIGKNYEEFLDEQKRLREELEDRAEEYSDAVAAYKEITEFKMELEHRRYDLATGIPEYVSRQGVLGWNHFDPYMENNGNIYTLSSAERADNPELWGMIRSDENVNAVDHRKARALGGELDGKCVQWTSYQNAINEVNLAVSVYRQRMNDCELFDTEDPTDELAAYGIRFDYEMPADGDGDYDISQDMQRSVCAMKLLAGDLQGYNRLHQAFAREYNALKAGSGNIRRMLRSGEFDTSDYENIYEKPVKDALYDIIGYSAAPTWIGAAGNPGLSDEIDLEDMMSDMRQSMEEAAAPSYVPVQYVALGIASQPEEAADGKADGEAEGETGAPYDGKDDEGGGYSVNMGGTLVINVHVELQNASNTTILWESLDPDIASVDENGVIHGLLAGTAHIRARTADAKVCLDDEGRAVYENGSIRIEDGFAIDFEVKVGGVRVSLLEGDNGEKTAEISEYNASGGEVSVPSEVDGAVVTALGEGVFAGNKSVESIVVPMTVTDIGREAFRDCTSLRYLSLPACLYSIGEDAFSGCGALEIIYFAGTVEAWDELMEEAGSLPAGVEVRCGEADAGILSEKDMEEKKESGSSSSEDGKDDDSSSSGSGKDDGSSSESGKQKEKSIVGPINGRAEAVAEA